MAKPNYVTIDDLKLVFPQEQQAEATDDSSGTDLHRDDSIVKEHLKFAESKVESYLVEYDLPFDNPPHSVKWAVLVVAAYMLMLRGDLATSENVERLYENVIQWLDKVQAGEATLPGIDTVEDDYVGFGKTGQMSYEYFPYQDFVDNYII